MASKVLMGDMPELMENLLNNLNNEFHSLFSCALVQEWINLESVNSSKNRIIILLIKLLAESGATLHKLDLSYSSSLDDEINFAIFYSIGRHEQLFSQLRDLSLSLPQISTGSAAALLSILTKNTTKIIALKLDKFCSEFDQQLFQALIRIIESQEQLRLFSIIGEENLTELHGIISALESHTNSLQEIMINYCDYNAEIEVLKNCKKLETLRIRFCDTTLLKILNNKVRTLEIADFEIDATTMVQILKKFGILLQQLKLEPYEGIREESLLLKSLKSFRPNITYLDISNIEFSIQLLDLICNLQKLQFLTLWCTIDIPEQELKIRVMQFAKILPLTLQYLDLCNNPWLDLYLDILFNHCNAPLKKLIINILDNEKNTKALIEFCLRNRALNYVGLYSYWRLNDNFRKEMEAYVSLVPYTRIVFPYL
ncbi:hypothetical protein F8M41_004599 [Gigaspora margarita]|uniref:RNI-like protein n=1 Tax=Gigaspora margarita TaxID=4874 RepID=A0A8H4AXM1_GIGMA|nr:hypothetical protein F8M41_004599 [Gigaspora margarita]